MIKQFSLLQLFSIIDGRLSTTMDDVYEILGHVCDMDLFTHMLPVAKDYVHLKNPKWLIEQTANLISLGISKEMPFTEAYEILKSNNVEISIPQLKDEFDVSDFEKYMVDNSLLLKRLNS